MLLPAKGFSPAKDRLKPSIQNYDWLGNGIYFWADSPDRAWAAFKEKTHIQLSVRNPDIIVGYFRVDTLAFAAA